VIDSVGPAGAGFARNSDYDRLTIASPIDDCCLHKDRLCTGATAEASARPLSPALGKTFNIGLVLKGLDGVLEVVDEIRLRFLCPQAIQHPVRALTEHELSEDPHDLIARYLLHTTAHLHHGTTLFGAVYPLSTASPRSSW
jgi:hypothetical protein